MSRHRWVALAAWTLAAVTPLAAQNAPRVFDDLAGEWHGEGTLMRRAARFTMRWDRHEGLAILTFTNAFADSSGRVTPVLHAAAVYRTRPATPEAVWLDSRGVRVEIRWEATDSTLVANWTAPTESGRTTYRVRSADGVDVVDEVMATEGWRTFGTARYRRVPPR